LAGRIQTAPQNAAVQFFLFDFRMIPILRFPLFLPVFRILTEKAEQFHYQ